MSYWIKVVIIDLIIGIPIMAIAWRYGANIPIGLSLGFLSMSAVNIGWSIINVCRI